jgi:hypothetical protein
MSEPTPGPALTPTADTNPYVSVSWVAVGAMAAASLFLILLVVLGVVAFREKKPLLLEELLVLPLVAIVLSFAAKRLIQNSEGTRTGVLDRDALRIDLVKSSWWIAVVGGLGFAAYLFAIGYSVRRDAAIKAEEWAVRALNDDPDKTGWVFLRTLDPGRRATISPDDLPRIEAEFGPAFLAFKQADLLLLAKRNPKACQFTNGGVKDWVYQPGLTKCAFAGTVRCPEGLFPVEFEMRGTEGGAKADVTKAEMIGRQWSVTYEPGQKFILHDKVTRTPYGWRVAELEASAGQAARQFLDISAGGPGMRAYAYQTLVTPTPDPALIDRANVASHARVFGFDTPMAFTLTPDYAPYMRNQFVRLRDGAEPSTDQRELFLKTWNESGLLPVGRRIKGNEKLDSQSTFSVTDVAVEVRVPCEVPLYGSGTAARGRLVLVCTEPDVLADVKKLLAEANPDQGTGSPPPDLGKRPYRWRVARVETDLKEVKAQQAASGPRE